MANRKRNIQMKFYVTEEEKRLIDEKMAQLPTRRYGAYLRTPPQFIFTKFIYCYLSVIIGAAFPSVNSFDKFYLI